MSLKVIDLNDVLLDMDIMLKRLLGEDIELLTVYGAAPAHVKADQDQIGQIIMNIAVNPRDAMHGGGKLTIETANAVLDATYVQGCAEIETGTLRSIGVQRQRYRNGRGNPVSHL